MMLKHDEDADESPATLEAPNDAADEGMATRLLDLVEIGQERPTPTELALEPSPRIAGVVMGRLIAVDPVLVAWRRAPGGVSAKTLVALGAADCGREVALLFAEQDEARPLVMGLVHESPAPLTPSAEAEPARTSPVDVTMDKKRLVLEAADEIVLRCGNASITLTKAGKVLISGAYVSSTASGTHRIRGGSVEIN